MNALKIIGIYHIFYLLVPLFCLLFFGQHYSYVSPYFIAEITLSSVLFLSLAVITLFLSAYYAQFLTASTRRSNQSILSLPFRAYLSNQELISMLLFIVGLAYFFYGSNDYRYGGASISEQGNFFFILIFRSMALIYLLNYIKSFILNSEILNLKNYFCANAHSLFLLSTNGGSADLLIGAFMFILTAFPYIGKNLIIARKDESEFGRRNLLRISVFGLSPIILIVAILIGESVKTDAGYLMNFDELLDALGLDSINFFLLLIIDSISTHLYALINYLNYGIQYHSDVNILYEIFQNFLFRLNTIFGEPFLALKPDIFSISRLNYLELTHNPISLHEGSSPGLYGSFIMVFGKYIGFIISAIYLLLLAITLEIIFQSSKFKINICGAFIICQALLFLFASPLDMLVIFDNSFVVAIFYLSFFAYCKEAQSLENMSTPNE